MIHSRTASNVSVALNVFRILDPSKRRMFKRLESNANAGAASFLASLNPEFKARTSAGKITSESPKEDAEASEGDE